MTDFSAIMNRVDARLDDSGISDDLTLPNASVIRGRFLRYQVEQATLDGGVIAGGVATTVIEFRTAATAAVLALAENAIVTHAGQSYRVYRKVSAGDHVGRISIELGAV